MRIEPPTPCNADKDKSESHFKKQTFDHFQQPERATRKTKHTNSTTTLQESSSHPHRPPHNKQTHGSRYHIIALSSFQMSKAKAAERHQSHAIKRPLEHSAIMDNFMMHPAMLRRYCEGYFEPLRVPERKNGLDIRGFFTISAGAGRKNKGWILKRTLQNLTFPLESP